MRRPVLQTVLALALAALFVAPVAAVEPGGATRVTLHGVLDGYYVETFEESHPAPKFELRTRTGTVPVEFAEGSPEELAGATVDLTGRRIGRTLHVQSSKPGRDLKVRRMPASETVGAMATVEGTAPVSDTSSTTTTSSVTTAATVTKNFAIILINFTDNTATPFSATTVQNSAMSTTGLKAFYEEESKGRMAVNVSTFGWYRLQTTSTTCDWSNWTTMGYNAATAAGVNLSGFTNFIYIIPDTAACTWAGIAYINGTRSVLDNTYNSQVMTHEIGHNFGLNHANALYCAVNGTRVALSSTANCSSKGYQDPFSTMGNNALRHNHASHLGRLGWVSDAEKITGTPGNTYTISPYFSSGTTKWLRVARGDGSYFDLDFRTPYGTIDNFTSTAPAVTGVTIRLVANSTATVTDLIDTTPATTDLKDAPLAVGRTLTDPVSTLSFTTVSATTAGVKVQVKEGITPGSPGTLSATASSTPKVDLSWGAATDNVAVASYTITRNGAPLATVTAPATTYSDTTVAFGTTYTYAVAAVDTSGNTGAASNRSVTTPADPNPSPSPSPSASPSPSPSASPDPSASPSPSPSPSASPDPSASPSPSPSPSASPDPTLNPADVDPPTAPEPFAGTAGASTVTLTWGAATDDVGVTGYQISRNGTVVTTVGASAASWKDTSRKPSTTYTYAVRAVDTGGNKGPASSLSIKTAADTVKPSTPRNFHVSKRWSRGYVTFAWSPSTDNVRVLAYKIYREGRVSPIATTSRTSIKIYTVKYVKYFVRAFDTSYNRSYGSRHVRGR